MSSDGREFFDRFIAAVNGQDLEALRALLHPDLIADSPQSGERSRGVDAFMMQFQNYPIPDDEIVPEIADAQLLNDEDRWALTPAFTVVPLVSNNQYTTVLRTRYPDGTWWWNVSIAEIRDGKLYRLESFYSPQLAAPLAESIASYPHG